MSSLINKKNSSKSRVTSKNQSPSFKPASESLSDFEQRIKLISSKIDERSLKGGIRLAASEYTIAPVSTNNYQKLLSKHPQRAKFAAPNPESSDSFF